MKYIYQITILDTKSVQYFKKLKDLCIKHEVNYTNTHYSLSRTKKDYYETENIIIQKYEIN
jgi:hypothetical protein